MAVVVVALFHLAPTCHSCCYSYTTYRTFCVRFLAHRNTHSPALSQIIFVRRLNQLVKLYSICMQGKFRLMFDLPCITQYSPICERGPRQRASEIYCKLFLSEPQFLCTEYSQFVTILQLHLDYLINGLQQKEQRIWSRAVVVVVVGAPSFCSGVTYRRSTGCCQLAIIKLEGQFIACTIQLDGKCGSVIISSQ